MSKRKKRRSSETEAAGTTPPAASTTPKSSRFKKRTNRFSPKGELLELITELGGTSDKNMSSPIRMGSKRSFDSGRLRTGILTIDLGLGGGWRTSRAGMIVGEKSSGKSTLSLMTAAQLHRTDPNIVVGYVDIEGTYDATWAAKLGCDIDRIAVLEPDSGEEAVDLADSLLRVGEIGLVITDSIAMLAPVKELDESASQDFMGLQARLCGKYVRRTGQAMITERKRGHYVSLLHLNQFRMKIGIAFGDPRTLPGGKALEYSTTQQLEVKNSQKKGKDSDGEECILFNEHNTKITKNKSGGRLSECMFRLIRADTDDGLPEGFVDQAAAVRDFGNKCGLVSGSKQSFLIEGYGKFKGALALNKFALENPTEYLKIQDTIIARFKERWRIA